MIGDGKLLRLVDGSTFPAREIVATYDKINNLILVRADWWEWQNSQVQRAVWASETDYVLRDDFWHLESMRDDRSAAPRKALA